MRRDSVISILKITESTTPTGGVFLFEIKYFNNPFRDLKGNELPLGAIGQEIYVNPAKGRVYNIDDFAGLLAKYEADVKAEYTEINVDYQYPATIVRQELQKAFTTWRDFEDLIMGISASLYNGTKSDEGNGFLSSTLSSFVLIIQITVGT